VARQTMTHLLCLDDHKTYSEDVKKRFSDNTRYIVSVFHNPDEFLKNFRLLKENNYCKVAIMGLHDSKENSEVIEHLIIEIKKLDNSTGVIVLAPPEKLDEIRKVIRFNVDSYVPRNANTILRIHNTVKKLISEHSLLLNRRKRNISFYVLVSFILLSILFAFIARIEFPLWF
jgi:DNA-binding NarL/FixJ family response regulator